jgi:hypothetical protein
MPVPQRIFDEHMRTPLAELARDDRECTRVQTVMHVPAAINCVRSSALAAVRALYERCRTNDTALRELIESVAAVDDDRTCRIAANAV